MEKKGSIEREKGEVLGKEGRRIEVADLGRGGRH